MSFTILKCNKCGRVFVQYNCSHKRVECPNIKVCNNRLWIEKENMINIKFGTDFLPIGDTAYIYISVFNNYAYLAAKVYSQDGNNFMIIPISERMVSPVLSRKDTIIAIPAELKHTTSWDGIIIKSGCYPVSPEMETEIKKNIYIRDSEVINAEISGNR